MSIWNVISLVGGLSLFLYGMHMMSGGLESAAGDRMKQILEKLTANRFMGVLVGAVMTTVIQSSSATTVMVVGFVNAKMMTLSQAVWIIMGANIGATTTGQLVALDIGALAPLFAAIGVFMIMFSKNQKVGFYGQCIAGLGVLFIGMEMMSEAMMPLRESEMFIEMITHFSNPLVGILVGAGFTALIQSSGASVGILQALAMTGVVQLSDAVYVLFGQNIGTCITSILASIGTSKEAKQTTVLHLSFNLIGTVLFTIVCMMTPLTSIVSAWTPGNAAAQIANMHTLFNVVTTILLIPFGYTLVKFAQKIMPSDPAQEDSTGLMYLKPLPHSNMIGQAAINVQQVNDEVIRMMNLAYLNVDDAFEQLLEYKEERQTEIQEREKVINFLDDAISTYISEELGDTSLNIQISQTLSAYYLMLVDIERIGDYAISLTYQAQSLLEKKLTAEEKKIIQTMSQTTHKMRDSIFDIKKARKKDQEIDDLTQNWRDGQIEGLKTKAVSSEVAVVFSRIFADYERINDHALNLAEEILTVEQNFHSRLLEEAFS